MSVFQNAANTMADWFTASNDYIETLNLFNVTMGEASEGALEFANSVSTLMGIDVADWMQYQGIFKQLTSGFGVAAEKADIMSQNLTQLSYDMASFFNTDVETAFDKLSSAMSGQVKGLREFGIDTTVASLQQYALAQGIEKSVSKMSQAEKSLLRYNYIMEQSTIIQGDMARTIATPANALRILNAQLDQMKRALGNIVSVLVARFIPYVQAMVRVVTEAATAIAAFFGFELPKIDYSGLGDNFSGAFEDAEDSLDGISGSIKKIKKQLMGFDELNILSAPDTGSGGGGSSGSIGTGLEVKPLEYDFLKGLDTSKVDEIYSKIKKLLKPLKKIGKYLEDYKDSLIVLGAIIAAWQIAKTIKGWWSAAQKWNFVQTFLDGFALVKATGGSTFESLNAGIASVRYNLTGIQKAAIVGVAGLLELVLIKDSVKELALGCEDVAAKITTIGGAAGGAALAMFVALGPAGLAVAAVVGLTGAAIGMRQAYDEMKEQLVEETFYNDVGIKITDLASDFSALMDKIVELNQPILDNKEKIDDAASSISDCSSNIELLVKAYDRGAISTDEFVASVTAKLDELNASVKTIMDATYENIVYALSTSLGDVIEEAGGSVEEYLEIIGKLKGDADSLYTSLIEKQEELGIKFANGEISSKEYAAGLNDINTKLASLAGSTSIVTTFSDKIMGLKGTVNWENENARNNAFEIINSSAGDAKAAVNESCDEIKRDLELMQSWTTDQESLLAIDELLLGNEVSRQNQLAEIDTAINSMYDTLQTDLVTKTNEVAEAASKEWDNMGGWARFWSGSSTEAEYVADVIGIYNRDFVTPISDEIQSSMETLGTDGSAWASDAMTKIMADAFDYGMNGAGPYVKDYSANLKGDVEEILESAGGDATQGYADGVTNNIAAVEGAFEKITQSGIEAVKKTQNSHSPSKEHIKLGKDAVDGYAKGIINNFKTISDAWDEKLGELFKAIKSSVLDKLTKSLTDITSQAEKVFSSKTWDGYVKNINTALAKIKIPTFKSIGLSVSFDTWVGADKKKVYEALGLSGWPRLSWYTYASGGIPNMGEMFIARERGPELVGQIGRKNAVANNDQIIEGISAGVYRAMMAANGENGKDITVNATFEMDGEVVGKKVIKYHNGVVMQTGESPLLV